MIYFTSKLPIRFTNCITQEIEYYENKELKTIIPGYVSMEDIINWEKSKVLWKVPNIARKTIIQVFQVMLAHNNELIEHIKERIESLKKYKGSYFSYRR